MATVTQPKSAVDSTDFAALMRDAVNSGNTDPGYLFGLVQQRDAKIGSNPDKYKDVMGSMDYLQNVLKYDPTPLNNYSNNYYKTLTDNAEAGSGLPGSIGTDTYVPPYQSPEDRAALEKLVAESNARVAAQNSGTTGAPPATNTKIPVAQPNNNNTELATLIQSILNNQNAQNAQYATQRQAQVDALGKIMSGDNYNSILDKVLAMNMPGYDSGKTELAKQYAAKGTAINVDTERRGLYNSGVAANLQDQNQQSQVQAVADLLAQIKQMSASQAKDFVNQQLTAANMTGDWLSTDRQLGQTDNKTSLDAYFGLDKAALDKTLGLGNLAVAQQNANTSQTGMQNDYSLGLGNLSVSQQNASTNATSVANNYELGAKQLSLDTTKYTEGIRQFNEQMKFSKDVQTSNVKQAAAQLSLDWSKLSADQASQLASNQLAQAQLTLQQNQFTSQQEKDNFEKNTQMLAVSSTAMDNVKKMVDAKAPVQDIYDYADMYKQISPDTYDMIRSTANNYNVVQSTAVKKAADSKAAQNTSGVFGTPSDYGLASDWINALNKLTNK